MFLKDKTLIVAVAIAVLAAVVLALIPLDQNVAQRDPGTAGSLGTPSAYYPLTEGEKKKAQAIALDDSFVQEAIWSASSVDGTPLFSPPGNPSLPGTYVVGNIEVARVHEISPDGNVIRYLPDVELISGNGSEGGINVHAYVDPAEERVAYVGFTARSGLCQGHYFYQPDQNSVAEFTDILWGEKISNFYMLTSFGNYTIRDTGYQQGLTEKVNAELIAVAESNHTVTRFMDSAIARGARVNPAASISIREESIDGYWYVGSYPSVAFLPIEKDSTEGDTVLGVTIDHGQVTSVEEQPNYGREWRLIDRHNPSPTP